MAEQQSPPTPVSAQQAKAPQAKSSGKAALPKRRVDVASLPFWVGLLMSIVWAFVVMFAVAKAGPTHSFGGVDLIDWAIGISAIVSPIALVWMVAAYLQRAADVQSVAEPLRRQLSLITGESGAAEARIRRFNGAIREQIDLLRSAQSMTKNDLVSVMDRVRGHKGELERLEQVSIHQVKDIQDIIRRNMQQVEQMMDDKFTMMRVLDDKLVQNGDGVARQIEAVRDQVAELLEEVEGNSRHLADTLTRAVQDSKRLSDTSRAQENSLITAAESAAETLGAISGKIDLSVARFMERAGSARQEAERLAGALDTQTRALDEFSSTLPTRVGEAESVLRGVADRLYASEQLAREQAINLSDKLSGQVDGLQQFLDRFTLRMADINGGLQERHTDLDALGLRIGSTTENFVHAWEQAVGNLSDRADSMIGRFEAVNDETRAGVDRVAASLQVTADQYAGRFTAVNEQARANIEKIAAALANTVDQYAGRFASVNSETQSNVDKIAAALADTVEQYAGRFAAVNDGARANIDKIAAVLADTVEKYAGRFDDVNEQTRVNVDHVAAALVRTVEQYAGRFAEVNTETRANAASVAAALLEAVEQSAGRYATVNEQMRASADKVAAEIELTSDRYAARFTAADQETRANADKAAAALLEAVEQSASRFNAINEQTRTNADKVAASLLETVEQYSGRFGAVNDQTRANADKAAAALQETVDKYETVTARMRNVSEEGVANMKAITGEIVSHLDQFESLRVASQRAGEEVQDRAATAMQNFQHVLERLLAARDAVQSVGGTLVKDLHGAVDQNEHLIGRLNEAAQMSVRALGIATESLGKQEGSLASQTRAAQSMLQEAVVQLQDQAQTAEKGLREQATGLMALLGETQTQMTAADEKLQAFAARSVPPIQEAIRQIDASAEQGMASMGRYGEGLNDQLNRLQQFNGRISGMGEELGRVTSETVTSIEDLNTRFASARALQEDTVRNALAQFNEMADRLQREVVGLDGQTAQAVDTLQQAAAKVGEQSYTLLQNAENSGAKMQLITTALQNEAAQIRSVLQKQADDLGADLSRAEKQFAGLGDALRQRTDAAYSLLDRVASHYNETTRSAAQDLEARAARIEQVSSTTSDKVEALNTHLSEQIALLDTGAIKLEGHATDISSLAGKTLQHLTSVNEKFSVTHEAANTNIQTTIARLDECNNAFVRQSNGLADAAQNAASLIQKAGVAFGEQAGKVLDTSQQMDQSLRQMTATTGALAEQSTQIRNVMEQQNQRLITQLTESVAQLEATGSKLERSVAAATVGTDDVTTRINEATQNASQRLGMAHQEMQGIAGKAETTLAALGANITQQASSLSVISEQLNDQYRTLGAASEGQRSQLIDLFDKLGSAHGQASEVAERTIARLSESLQQVQRQLGALSDQSQTAVGNVRTAGSSFADQAGLLLQNAQQAEQQARTVLSVTAALQDQARQLRESLHGESERTSDILGSLLGRLSSSGVELRDLGSSTELILTSLQNGITQQAVGLNGSMQQIADRQRTLTVALDAQRDVINGLLSRLTLAQDETASTAERTITRLTDSTQQLTRQIEQVEHQAQSTLASVQSVGGQFADQAGALGLHAQQAEQQMRGVLSVTAGMQEQARQLREAMQGESARVIEQLNAVIGQLDTTNSQLKIQSTSAVHAVEQSTLQFGTMARSTVDAMSRQGEVFAQTAAEAEVRMTNAGEKLRSHIKIVGESGEQAEQQARQLADSAEYASSRLITLRETFTTSDKDARETLVQASARIEEVKTRLQDEMSRLADLSQDAVAKVAAASQQLTEQSDAVRSSLSVSESALSQAADLVREESKQIPAIIDRSTYKIEAASMVLRNQAGDAEKTLIGTADRFISVTTTARESMVDEMRRVSAVADEAGQVLRAFNATLTEQVTSMQQGTTSFSDNQKDLIEKAGESVAQLSSASDRLAELRRDAAQTAEKLSKEFEALDQRVGDTSQRLAHAGDNVSKQVENLTQQTQRAETTMLDATKGFREQFERVRTSVQGQIDDINRGLMQITAQLERTGNTLRSTTAGTVADVERISQRFDATSKEAATQLVDKTARMRGATEEVAKLLSGFGDQLDVLLDRLSVAGDGIKRHEGDLIAQLETALSHLGSLTTRLEDGRTLAASVSQQAVERLSSVVDSINQQAQSLTSSSQTATGVLRGVGQIYNDQTQALNRGVGEAQTQVQEMNRSIDDMQQRADRMRVSLKMQSDELMSSLQQILSQLHETGDALGDAVDTALQEKAAQGMKKIV